MDDPILLELEEATRWLTRDQVWLQLAAENLKWASCEGFFQSSLLGAFNVRSQTYIADREKRFALSSDRSICPDLLILERASYVDWWAARRHTKQAVLRPLCRGAVQMKLVWTKNNASGSATVKSKAKSVVRDATDLEEFCRQRMGCTGYLAVLFSGRHAAEGRRFLDEAVQEVQEKLCETSLVVPRPPIPLFENDYKLEHWTRLVDSKTLQYLWANQVWFTIQPRVAVQATPLAESSAGTVSADSGSA